MLNSTDLRNGTVFNFQGKDWVVLNYEFIKTGRGSGTVKVKVKDLISGSIVLKGFNMNQKFDESSVEKKTALYTYADENSFYFMDASSFEEFCITKDAAPHLDKLFKEGDKMIVVYLNNLPISVDYPKTVTQEIDYEGGSAKGNSSSRPTKEAVTVTGLKLQVPLFVKKGDIIKIDSDNLTYLERVNN